MKAVNLIPEDLRGAGGAAPARTGPLVYVALGVLGAVVVMTAAWALASRSVTNKQNELIQATAQADAAEARAGALAPYTRFATVRKKRVDTVTELSRTRFNWPYAIREVSRVLPKDVWLVNMTGTVAPGVQVEGGGSTASSLRSQLPVPAVEMSGCTTDQSNVARFMARLRSVDGVTRVALSQSEKLKAQPQASGGGGGGGGGGEAGADPNDCRQGNAKIPKFDLVVFFERSTAKASTGPAPAAATPPPSDGNTTSGSGSSNGSTK